MNRVVIFVIAVLIIIRINREGSIPCACFIVERIAICVEVCHQQSIAVVNKASHGGLALSNTQPEWH